MRIKGCRYALMQWLLPTFATTPVHNRLSCSTELNCRRLNVHMVLHNKPLVQALECAYGASQQAAACGCRALDMLPAAPWYLEAGQANRGICVSPLDIRGE
jgi:hypothetical protein